MAASSFLLGTHRLTQFLYFLALELPPTAQHSPTLFCAAGTHTGFREVHTSPLDKTSPEKLKRGCSPFSESASSLFFSNPLGKLCSTLIQMGNHIHAALHTNFSTVQAQVIVIRLSPLSARIQLIERLTLLVLIMKSLDGGFLPLSVYVDNALGPLFIGGMDEYSHAISDITKNVVCTTAHNDAWALFRQICNHFLLGIKKKNHSILKSSGSFFASIFPVTPIQSWQEAWK